MGQSHLDMSVLASSGKSPLPQVSVPRPKIRWKTRVLLPAAILLCFAAVFGYSLRDTFMPATRGERARQKDLEEQFRREDPALTQQAVTEFQKAQTELKLATQRAMVALLVAKPPSREATMRQQETELAAAEENLKLRIAET